MISQIIFFIAVALLIALVLRRFPAVTAFSQVVVGWIQPLWQKGIASVSQVAERRRNRPARPARTAAPHQTMEQVARSQAGSFWQEEPIEEKPELSSTFEEGESLFHQGKLNEAEQFFIRAAAADPGNPKVYARLGLLYLQLKNYTDAIEALKVAVKLDKNNPSRHYNLALAYAGNKDMQRSIAAVREAISMDPVTPKYREFLEQLMDRK